MEIIQKTVISLSKLYNEFIELVLDIALYDHTN